MILVATVEHSGTHALLEAFGPVHLNALSEMHPGSQLLFAHLYDSEMDRILAARESGILTVTTLRSESDIRRSWLRRGRDLRELDRQLANRERLLK